MQKNFTIEKFQVVIIGSGGAGLMSAISAYDAGLQDIAIVSKVLPTYSHTVSAKGGINASLGNLGTDDWKFHAYDTLKGGDYLADVDAVEILCSEANQAIFDLEKFGVVFSRDGNGKIAQRAYGGQTLNYGESKLAYRACYSKDKTGHTIIHSLEQQALKRGIKFFNEFFVSDLLIDNQKAYGCFAIDIINGKINVFITEQIILATGGYSQIYKNTTSSSICTGDGTALVFKEGLALQDMEFVQFHPTGIFGSGFLITEAVRSEGAYLLNANGERFMKKYAPNMMELASRDVISQAIASEIIEYNNKKNQKDFKDYVYLDMRHISPLVMKDKLPNVIEMVKNFARKDLTKDLIPIAPSAHYSMGGIPCGIDCQVIYGLYAVGEAACLSVHGANRLGCNSLLDLIVFGKISGIKSAEKILKQGKLSDFEKNKKYQIAIDLANQKFIKFKNIFVNNDNANSEKFNIFELKESLLNINEKCLGVFRNSQKLELGMENIKKIYQNFREIKIKNPQLILNEELISYFELENLILNSLAVYFSAINRKESRGAHYRYDYQNRDDKFFLAHSMVKIIDLKQIKMEYFLKPVKNISFTTELNLIPQKRKY